MTGPAMTVGYWNHSTPSRQVTAKGDRQCPVGRLYMFSAKDIHFVIDPRFRFEWSKPLQYPDQWAFTKLCGLRFFMRTMKRINSAVLDGWTA